MIVNRDSMFSLIKKHYGIEVFSSQSIDTTNDVYIVMSRQGTFVFKSISDSNKLEIIVRIVDYLIKNGIPASKPLSTKKGKYAVDIDDQSYYLAEYLDGEVLRQTEYLERISVYGDLLARFHKATRPIEKFGPVMNIHDKTCKTDYLKLSEHFDDLHLKKIVEIISDNLDDIESLDRQLIHRDYHCDNVLFSEGIVSGMIDFDSCSYGYPVYDIAYFLAELLVHNPEIDIYKYADDFLDGYIKVLPLSDNDKQLIKIFMLIVHIDFASWFLDLGDFKSTKESIVHLKHLYNLFFR